MPPRPLEKLENTRVHVKVVGRIVNGQRILFYEGGTLTAEMNSVVVSWLPLNARHREVGDYFIRNDQVELAPGKIEMRCVLVDVTNRRADIAQTSTLARCQLRRQIHDVVSDCVSVG